MAEDFYFNLAESFLAFGGYFYTFWLGFIVGGFFIGFLARIYYRKDHAQT